MNSAPLADGCVKGSPERCIRQSAGRSEQVAGRDATAAGAFSGTHPELVSNTNWPGSAAK